MAELKASTENKPAANLAYEESSDGSVEKDQVIKQLKVTDKE